MEKRKAVGNQSVGNNGDSLLNLESSVRSAEPEVRRESRAPQLARLGELTPRQIETLRARWVPADPASFAAHLVEDNLTAEALAEPTLLTRQEAIQTAIEAKRLEPQLDISLMGLLPATPVTQWTAEEANLAGRLLAIVAEISDGTRLLAPLNRVMRSPVPAVKSKAILLLVRATRNAGLAEQRLKEVDDRVRANAVEGLWNNPSPEARDLLRALANDHHHRVRGNAVAGLHLVNDPEAPELLLAMLQHESPAFRKTAIWVMGFLADPRYLPQLNALRNDPQSGIHGCAIRAMLRIRRSMATPPADRKG